MSFFKEIKEVLGQDPESVTHLDEVSEDNPLFVYVRIPGDIDPMDRHEIFADPLCTVLENEGLGTVTGGGSLLSDEGDGSEAEFCGIDVDLYDAVRGLELLRNEMKDWEQLLAEGRYFRMKATEVRLNFAELMSIFMTPCVDWSCCAMN